MLARLRSLIRILRGRDRFEREMRDEMDLHLELQAADLQRAGLSREEARRRARLEFGGLDGAKEDCRQSRGVRFFDQLGQDVRYAVRLMRKTPGFTAAAVLSLALGIGANTAIFSLMDAVLLRTLPLADVDELVFLAHGASRAESGISANYPLFDRYAALFDVFSGVTAYSSTGFKVETGDGLDAVTGLWASGNFHGLLGVPIAHGRGFNAERDRDAGSAMIAVISDAYWARRFGRDPSVLGRTIIADGHVVTIVGVTAPEFTGLIPGRNPEITLPLSVRAIAEPGYLTMHDTWTNLSMVARLRDGVTETAALAATDAAFQQYMSEPENRWIRTHEPEAYSKAQLVPAARGSNGLRRQYETALDVLMGMVAVVLLIASVNVANLLLVRGTARAREVAIRLCIGGGRSRLIRQFLTESVLLALCGGALGLVLAIFGTMAIMGLFSALEAPLLIDVTPNARVLFFTGGVSLLTGVVFGLLPAVRATGVDLTPVLKAGMLPRVGVRRWSAAQVLVASQVALSVLVLAIAALLVRSLYNLKTLDAGFERGNLLLFTMDTFGTPIRPEARADLYAGVLDRVRSLPGVRSVSGSTSTPVHTSGNARALHLPPHIQAPDNVAGRAAWMNFISPDYFQTLGIRVVRGRSFTNQDRASSQKVAIINETMARFWAGDRDPLGMTLSFRGDEKNPLTIVGVVEDTHQMNLRDAPPRTVYMPLTQTDPTPWQLMVVARTTQEPATLANAAHDAVRAVSRDIVVRYVRSIEDQINASLTRERVLAALSGGFAGLAVLLSAIGLYGVMSYSVTRRSREIGIRLALGAARARVLRQVLRQSLAVSLAGMVAGLASAYLATTTLTTFLFDLSPRDPATFASVCLVLLLISFVSGFLPARRAATLDPVAAIRRE
jgi:predicted permease